VSAMNDDQYTVSAAAELAGVSVRALHYYDQIGLARPSRRSAAGYRLYTADDVSLLQRVVFYRELGLELEAIADLLAAADSTDEDHLRWQRDLIEQRIAQHNAMLKLIDKELAARAAGIALTPQQRRTVFGGDRLLDHADDAHREWGATPEFIERRRRTARYTEQDWMKLRTELAAINQDLAAAITQGTPPTDPLAMDLAERLRLHTHFWFHDCGFETHRGMAEHYRANARSGLNYDDMVPGLSQYVYDAILANCDRGGRAQA